MRKSLISRKSSHFYDAFTARDMLMSHVDLNQETWRYSCLPARKLVILIMFGPHLTMELLTAFYATIS